MYRLNVAVEQIEECVKSGMFALTFKPKIEVGEILLLQLKKSDWKLQGSKGGRINHALVFQRAVNDQNGEISKKHWPNAGKLWPWIIYSSAVLDVEPFSLEDLPLIRESHYQAQANPAKIDAEDALLIKPYIKWSTAVPLNVIESSDEAKYAISEIAKTLEELSVGYALLEIKNLYPDADIEVMKHNNPGFDILVTRNNQVVRFVEVKGTQLDTPVFNLTETERKFSKDNASLYSIYVIWKIDLKNGTYKTSRYDGEMSVGEILKPHTYLGRLDT